MYQRSDPNSLTQYNQLNSITHHNSMFKSLRYQLIVGSNFNPYNARTMFTNNRYEML